MKREGKEEEKTKKKRKARFVSFQDKSRLGKILTHPIIVFLVGLILFRFNLGSVRYKRAKMPLFYFGSTPSFALAKGKCHPAGLCLFA